MESISDEELVRKSLEGESGAFDQLVYRYQVPMYRTVQSMITDPDEAKDVTQNGFVKAWEKLDTFNSDHRFFSWLYKIVINESLNSIRKQRNYANINPLHSDGSSPHIDLVSKEESRQIQNAIDSLSPSHRIVIQLRHFEELSYQEISDILEIELITVKSRLYSARMQLRDRILISK